MLESNLPPFPVWRWTLDEYHALVDQGSFDDERVELLEGWIVPKMTRNPPHDAAVVRIDGVLRPLIPSGYHMRVQSAVTTGDSEPEPEPELAIVSGETEDYEEEHPGGQDILLLVEIADASLQKDRRKTRVYAAAGVNVVWIADLRSRQLEVYSGPMAASGEYQNRHVYQVGESIPLTLQDRGHEIPVERLFSRKRQETP
ncbi:Endonuclease, Uma2 family (restriction endonuclease fold) [Planctomicrobium piriforme]|uniref:Endonuclease, Uma2 family (Restriction endonuclease fold) n=2 Tax=Planctomicrobium piriforme TaxID=1576369 RepID=A0A1I3S6R8_9PLAN|nr:Endonuclease, Uma2 family (restriction endonuclease fold) [Planctomicrobium piriforme]